MRAKVTPRARALPRPRTHPKQATVDWLATSEIAWGAPHTLIAILVGLVVAWRGIAALVGRRGRP